MTHDGTQPTDLTDEPLEARLWRQVEHGIDEDRLLPSRHKRRRGVEKKLDVGPHRPALA